MQGKNVKRDDSGGLASMGWSGKAFLIIGLQHDGSQGKEFVAEETVLDELGPL
jgi:hypothetical protein